MNKIVYLFTVDDAPEVTRVYASMPVAIKHEAQFEWSVIENRHAFGVCGWGAQRMIAHLIPYEVFE